jgi:hypothetical protein
MGLRPLVGIRFQVLFHSPNRGSFHLSLALLFTIGHQVVLSLARWAALIHARFHGTGATRELRRRSTPFDYRAFTFSGQAFQPAHLRVNFLTPCHVRNRDSGSHNPTCTTLTGLHAHGLGSSLFDRLYWGSRCLFPFLQVLRWVSSLRSLPHTMDSCAAHEGLLHVVSESRTFPDRRPLASTRDFSQLSHVLRRLLVPRHPHVHPF